MNDNFNENENVIDENAQPDSEASPEAVADTAQSEQGSEASSQPETVVVPDDTETVDTDGAGSYTNTDNSQSGYTGSTYFQNGQYQYTGSGYQGGQNGYSSPYSTGSYSYGSYNQSQTGNRNEYVYDAPVPKKKGNGGKVAIGIIVGVLAVFVVSVTAISAFVAFSDNTFSTTQQSNQGSRDNSVTTAPDVSEDDDSVVLDEDDDSAGTVADDSTTEATAREYPTLEQLLTSDGDYTLTEIYEKVSPSVVGVSSTLSSGSATGTGIILTEDGYILTCAHVVEDATSIAIVDADMNQYEATLIGEDSQSDIAVLKIDASGLTAAELGILPNLKVGEVAIVIGNPLGYDLYGSMSVGIVSGLNRTLNINGVDMTLIQTDASVNSGNSGGPMVNAYGQVIGIISAKVSSSYGEGLGFAIPIDDAMPIIEDLIRYGYVTGRPSIGITGEDITVYVAFYYGIPQGVMVRYVEPGSGADVAGVQTYDIIVGVNDESITTMDELTNIKNNYLVGDTITLNIYRNGTYIDLEVELMEITG
ncbi:MAG: trypsin-like peptidase domain-containing protein [Oscillospiraceae bacterium]|nr:trypsin-like peptidase domain-containing protein [Oscillospiraceae bacterium]